MAEFRDFGKPETLYRYRSVSGKKLKREIESIEQRYIYCSKFEDLNDPMEGNFQFTQPGSDDFRMRDALSEIYHKKIVIGIACFSETPRNELMWAHYADQFKGICIAYDVDRLIKSLPDDSYLVRMYYDDMLPGVGGSEGDLTEAARKILSRKNHKWLYEREWRFFGALEKVHYRDDEAVSAIYLGSRISPQHERGLLRKLERRRIQIYKVQIDDYVIKFDQLI